MTTTTPASQARPEETEAPQPQGPPSVLAVVVTHSGRRWFKETLVGLNTQTYELLDVLVVDDASPDSRQPPSLKRVAKRHLRRRRWGYLRTPRPLGFGGAINWALARVKTDADLLLFIHDDAALSKTSVEKMVARLIADPATAIVGPKVVSWTDRDVLEEVGMSADRFGYPYKGLEEGEIDLGQHDVAREVFYVTSTCMLVRHDVFRQLRGWDARLHAYAEDLDLCWRARIAGHTVRVEPQALARHAIAMATGQRSTPFKQVRYFSRRNRLRTIIKSVSGLRLLALIPQFIVLAFAEMVGFIALRQPREALGVLRALGWNLINFPQSIAERTRVQRTRKVPDAKLRPLHVREATRMRFYLNNQADRFTVAWGRRADVVATRAVQARALVSQLRGITGVIALVGLIGFLIAFRHLLWGPTFSVGEMLPFPDRPTGMWRAFASPWQSTGLGQPGPSSPAFVLLGFFPVITFGAVGAAQKLLIIALGGAAFLGAYGLVSELVDRVGRLTAGAVYSLGAVGYAGVRLGSLGALAFGAAAPFVLRSMIRLIGWARPPGWVRARAVARIALGGAISAAFVPGSLFLYALVAAVLASTRSVLDRNEKVLRGFLASIIGLVWAWVALLPWSATWFRAGGPLEQLFGDQTWRAYAASYRGHGIGTVLLGQTPVAPVLFGLALPLLGAIALFVGEGQRRRMALGFWAVLVAVGALITLNASGLFRPLVASPTEAGVIAALAFSGLAGLAVGAFRLDLPRKGLGRMHAITLGGFSLALFLIAAGTGPALWQGDWGPGRGSVRRDARTVEQVRSLLEAEAVQIGQFRALWVGDGWTPPTSSVARPVTDRFVTGPRGQLMTDLFERRVRGVGEKLDRAIASIEEGATDRGGGLLGAFNVHYVILEPGDENVHWLAQRDLALVRSERDYLLLENEAQLPRSGAYDDLPAHVRAIEPVDPRITTDQLLEPAATGEQQAAWRYDMRDVEGPGVAFVAEAADEGWTGEADGEQLERVEGGWGNAFEIPDGSSDVVTLSHPRTTGDLAFFVFLVVAWLVLLGAAFPRERRTSAEARVSE
jgi:GT2 family glycosyltransferase